MVYEGVFQPKASCDFMIVGTRVGSIPGIHVRAGCLFSFSNGEAEVSKVIRIRHQTNGSSQTHWELLPLFLSPGMMYLGRWPLPASLSHSALQVLHPTPWAGSSIANVLCHSPGHGWPEALVSSPDARLCIAETFGEALMPTALCLLFALRTRHSLGAGEGAACQQPSWASPSLALSCLLCPLPLPKPHVWVMVSVEVSTLGSLPHGWGGHTALVTP